MCRICLGRPIWNVTSAYVSKRLLSLPLFLLLTIAPSPLLLFSLKEVNCGDGKYKYVGVAEKLECDGIQHLEKIFQDLLDRGGEGVILRDPLSLYQPGRSPGYLKHKVYTGASSIYTLANPHNIEIPRRRGKNHWICGHTVGVWIVRLPNVSNATHATRIHNANATHHIILFFFIQAKWSEIPSISRHYWVCETRVADRRYRYIQTSWVPSGLKETKISNHISHAYRYGMGGCCK